MPFFFSFPIPGLKVLTIPVSEGVSWSSDSSSPIIMDPKTVVKIVAENQGKGLVSSIGPPFGMLNPKKPTDGRSLRAHY